MQMICLFNIVNVTGLKPHMLLRKTEGLIGGSQTKVKKRLCDAANLNEKKKNRFCFPLRLICQHRTDAVYRIHSKCLNIV